MRLSSISAVGLVSRPYRWTAGLRRVAGIGPEPGMLARTQPRPAFADPVCRAVALLPGRVPPR